MVANSDQQRIVGETAPDWLQQREYGRVVRDHLVDFGALIGIALAVTGAWQGYYHYRAPLAVGLGSLGLGFYLLGKVNPAVLYWPWKGWMKSAHVLGTVMTTVLLSIGWVLLVIPTALVARMCGVRPLNLEFRKGATTYWETRDGAADDFKLLERQF